MLENLDTFKVDEQMTINLKKQIGQFQGSISVLSLNQNLVLVKHYQAIDLSFQL